MCSFSFYVHPLSGRPGHIEEMSLLFIIPYSVSFSFTVFRRTPSISTLTFASLRGKFSVGPGLRSSGISQITGDPQSQGHQRAPRGFSMFLSAHTDCLLISEIRSAGLYWTTTLTTVFPRILFCVEFCIRDGRMTKLHEIWKAEGKP